MKPLVRSQGAPLALCLLVLCRLCSAGEPAALEEPKRAANRVANNDALPFASLAPLLEAPERSSATLLDAVPAEPLMLTPEPSWRLQYEPVPERPNPFAGLRFRDQQPLVNRLRKLQALPFVTLWDSRQATVYLGVNRDGETGLHLRQKRDDRGTRAHNPLVGESVGLQRTDVSRRAGPRAPRDR